MPEPEENRSRVVATVRVASRDTVLLPALAASRRTCLRLGLTKWSLSHFSSDPPVVWMVVAEVEIPGQWSEFLLCRGTEGFKEKYLR